MVENRTTANAVVHGMEEVSILSIVLEMPGNGGFECQASTLEKQKFDGNHVLFCFQCLLFVLGCKDSEDLSLNGHHVESLAELTINKFSAVSMGDKKTYL